MCILNKLKKWFGKLVMDRLINNGVEECLIEYDDLKDQVTELTKRCTTLEDCVKQSIMTYKQFCNLIRFSPGSKKYEWVGIYSQPDTLYSITHTHEIVDVVKYNLYIDYLTHYTGLDL